MVLNALPCSDLFACLLACRPHAKLGPCRGATDQISPAPLHGTYFACGLQASRHANKSLQGDALRTIPDLGEIAAAPADHMWLVNSGRGDTGGSLRIRQTPLHASAGPDAVAQDVREPVQGLSSAASM
jgi:hypothetical protein